MEALREIRRVGRWVEAQAYPWVHLDQSLHDQVEALSIYRYVPLISFLAQVETKELTFVSPQCWSDVYESDITRALFGDTKPLSGVDVLARCFTTEYSSDAIWRLYGSPAPTVRYRIRLANLVAAIAKFTRKRTAKAFLSPVEYDSPRRVQSRLSALIGEIEGRRKLQKSKPAASAFRLKRDAYRFEQEVRVLLICEGLGRVYSISLDPSDLDEVLIDPTLKAWEGKPLVAMLQRMMPGAKVAQSTLGAGLKHLPQSLPDEPGPIATGRHA